MSSLAIPSAPPQAAPSTDTGSTPATGDKPFDQTLRQSQPAPKTRGDRHKADDDADAPAHGSRKAIASTQGDEHSGNDTNPVPGMAPVMVIAPAPMRQSIAGSGEALPANGGKSARGAMPATTAANIATATPGLAPLASGTTITVGTPQSTSSAATSPDANLPAAMRKLAGDAGSQVAADGKDGSVASHAAPDNLLAHLVQLTGAHAGTAPSQPPPAQLIMQAMPSQPQFAQETVQHVAWLAGQDIQRAEIQLNPRKLGPIQVEITTHHDRVDVSFAVQHPQTVHALQQTLPQLHDMLAQQGLNLGHASVGQQSHGQPHATPAYRADGDSASVEPDSQSTLHRVRIATPGRVDDFA
ncbi:MAG TPA: flagellar hook-length control protein FliK [Rhodanobacteraceae bacterium]|nr:flagellar hook-length control protein FliK [Rhodanobacteraceae bacterium]